MKKLLLFSITALITLFFLSPRAYADYKTAKVERHLGKQIPLNLKFVDSEGKEVVLKDLINKPTILDFCYYHCSGICTPLMVELSTVIGKIKYDPGKDYDVISVSIDQNETPRMAALKKHAMFSISGRKIPESAWHFLTGDSANIYHLTDAAGFEFKRSIGGFLHKGVLVFLDKNGKIVNYLSPGYTQDGFFQILPAAMEIAINNASTGEITETIQSVLKTCYTFIPKGKDVFVFGLILVVGFFTVGVVLLIIKKAKIGNSLETK
jgi:protein SCO1/2